MPRSKLLSYSGTALVLVVAVLLLIKYVYTPEPKTTIADIGSPQTITIYWNGVAYPVHESSPFYDRIVRSTESALDSTSAVCKCVFEPKELADYKSIVIQLAEERTVKIAASPYDDRKIKQIIVPLNGSNYEQNVIATGSETSLGGHIMAFYKSAELYGIAELFALHAEGK